MSVVTAKTRNGKVTDGKTIAQNRQAQVAAGKAPSLLAAALAAATVTERLGRGQRPKVKPHLWALVKATVDAVFSAQEDKDNPRPRGIFIGRGIVAGAKEEKLIPKGITFTSDDLPAKPPASWVSPYKDSKSDRQSQWEAYVHAEITATYGQLVRWLNKRNDNKALENRHEDEAYKVSASYETVGSDLWGIHVVRFQPEPDEETETVAVDEDGNEVEVPDEEPVPAA